MERASVPPQHSGAFHCTGDQRYPPSVIEPNASTRASNDRYDRPAAPSLTRWTVARTLRRKGASTGLHPLLVQAILVDALLAPVHRAFDGCADGTIRLGAELGSRRLLRLGGLRVYVPDEGALVDPSMVTLVHREPLGAVRVRAGVSFGERADLHRAARKHGVCPELAVGLVGAVVASVGLLQVPVGAMVRAHLDGHSWEAMRVVEVVGGGGPSVRHIGLPDARLLVGEVFVGERVGVALPRQDWLTPVLRWAGEPG